MCCLLSQLSKSIFWGLKMMIDKIITEKQEGFWIIYVIFLIKNCKQFSQKPYSTAIIISSYYIILVAHSNFLIFFRAVLQKLELKTDVIEIRVLVIQIEMYLQIKSLPWYTYFLASPSYNPKRNENQKITCACLKMKTAFMTFVRYSLPSK